MNDNSELPSNEEELLEQAIALLEHRRFRITRIYDGSGADGGRDIEALTMGQDESGGDYTWKWWVELKYRSKRNLDISDIPDKIRRAGEQRAQFFLLITNAKVSAANTERMERVAADARITLRIWDHHPLKLLLREMTGTSRPGSMERVPLIDRVDELAKLKALILSEAFPVILIEGTGGVGKSALARYIIYWLGRDYSHAMIDSRLKHDIGFSFKVMADTFFRQGYKTPFAYSADQRLQESERLKLLLDHCLQQPTLLLIDNFEEVLDGRGHIADPIIRQLVEHFLGHHMNGSTLLITSRGPVRDRRITGQEGYRDLLLQGWDIDFVLDDYLPVAEHLNTRLAALRDDDKKRREQLGIFKGNPLALKIANQLCALYEFRELVSLLPKDQDPAQALVEAFSRELSSTQTRALNCFAQFDRPMTKTEIMRFVCDKQVLDSLLLVQLVEIGDSRGGQYQLHPITSDRFALRERPVERHALVLDLTDTIQKLVVQSSGGIDESYNHFLMRQVFRMFVEVEEYERAAEILSCIGTRAVSMGDVEYLTEALASIRDRISDLLNAKLLKVQGHIEDLLGRHDLAKATYQRMLDLGIELNDTWVRAAALNGLGTMERHGGCLEQAVPFYLESLALRQADDDLVGQSNSLHNLGAAHLEMGELDRARDYLGRALALREQLQDAFRTSATQIYLAECHCYVGEFTEARSMVQAAIAIKERFDDAVGTLWASLLLAKIDLLDPIRDDKRLSDNLRWCCDRADKLNKPRDQMLCLAFSGVHTLLTDPDDVKALSLLAEARKLADGLNQEQSALIRHTIASLAIGEPPEKLAATARDLVRRLKI